MTTAWSWSDLLATRQRADNRVVSCRRYGELVTAGQIEEQLSALHVEVLEPLAAALGKGTLSSCYRSPAVNAMVGGARDSAHLVGLAADWMPPVPYDQAVRWLTSCQLPLDRVIYEVRGPSRWLHVQRIPLSSPGRVPLWYVSAAAGAPYRGVSAVQLEAIARSGVV